jgi:hypothetical protein
MRGRIGAFFLYFGDRPLGAAEFEAGVPEDLGLEVVRRFVSIVLNASTELG